MRCEDEWGKVWEFGGKRLGELGMRFGAGVRRGVFCVNGYKVGFCLWVFDLVFEYWISGKVVGFYW